MQATLVMTLAHELSTIGRCATFDEVADGFARGEGCGALWVELAGKETDASCSIAGLDTQHAGRSVSLTAPSGNAQQTCLRAALRYSGSPEEEIAFIECHGTGTALGDPIEVGALRTVLRQTKREVPLLLGTVKTNVAHTEGASGVVGLIKCIVHMQHACAPPNLHLRRQNQHLEGPGINSVELLPPTELCPIAAKGKHISGIVSAFGLGGCNAVAVFEVKRDD